MTDLRDFANRLKGINLKYILNDSVMETKDSLLGENKMQLLFGEAVDGSDLGYYEDPEYAKFKANHTSQYHAPYGVYNFDLYGDFQDSMYISPALIGFDIGSKNSKEKQLEKLADGSSRVFGLNKNSDYPTEILKPVLLRRIRSHLGI